MWAILIAGALSLLSSCNFFYTDNNPAGNIDPVVLYQKDSLFAAKNFPFVFQCRLDEKEILQYNSKQPATLILENPKVITAPEGVYELYISSQPIPNDTLSSFNNYFVTTLDFYSLTAPEAEKKIEADISRQFNKILQQKNKPAFLYITIKLGAIKLANGSYSTNAGEFSFSGIKILQSGK